MDTLAAPAPRHTGEPEGGTEAQAEEEATAAGAASAYGDVRVRERVLASILWAVVILALAGIPDGSWTLENALFVVRLWIVPVVAVYAFGLGLTWVRRGFQAEVQ